VHVVGEIEESLSETHDTMPKVSGEGFVA